MKKIQVVHAVLEQEGKFLLGRRSESKKNHGGFWATIGGRLEKEETPQACLVRECLEELGVIVEPVQKMKEVVEPESIHVWFTVKLISGTPQLANDEHTELRWVTSSQAKALFPIVAEDLEIILSMRPTCVNRVRLDMRNIPERSNNSCEFEISAGAGKIGSPECFFQSRKQNSSKKEPL